MEELGQVESNWLPLLTEVDLEVSRAAKLSDQLSSLRVAAHADHHAWVAEAESLRDHLSATAADLESENATEQLAGFQSELAAEATRRRAAQHHEGWK